MMQEFSARVRLSWMMRRLRDTPNIIQTDASDLGATRFTQHDLAGRHGGDFAFARAILGIDPHRFATPQIQQLLGFDLAARFG
jgi:hypothetical protein